MHTTILVGIGMHLVLHPVLLLFAPLALTQTFFENIIFNQLIMSRYVSLARKVFRPNSAVFRVAGQVQNFKMAAPIGFKSFATDAHAHAAGKDEVKPQ
jgi:hypothetical protein